MKLSTLATKRASKKAKCYRQYKRAKDIIKESNNWPEQKDWWKRPASCKMNTKRKVLRGSTDVYLLKRTIELRSNNPKYKGQSAHNFCQSSNPDPYVQS